MAMARERKVKVVDQRFIGPSRADEAPPDRTT
jgi:hypothetical protein